MAGTTQYYGISYPTSTDYVKDGASAMQTIADGFDSAVAIPTYNNQTGTTYTFVLADAGKTVTSNNASAVTFTIPPQASVAWANNTTLTVRNLGAGVVTIAGGAGVTVTNTAQTVAQYGSVRIIRTASNAWTVVPASGGASGLTLIASSTFTNQTSVNILGCFSSTYDNYRVTYNNTSAASNADLVLRLLSGSTAATTNYFNAQVGINLSSGAYNVVNTSSNGAFFLSVSSANPEQSSAVTDINKPFLTRVTNFMTISASTDGIQWSGRSGGGMHTTASSYDGLQLVAGVNISGTIRVYGYQNS